MRSDKEKDEKVALPTKKSGVYFCEAFERSSSLGMWKSKKIRVDRDNQIIYAEKDSSIKVYVMKDYILRKSKNKDYHSFVLEAINNHPTEKCRTVHLGFKEEIKFRICCE